MENKPTYTLGKHERLKSRKAIDQLFTNGRSFSLFPFRVVFQKSVSNTHAKTINPALQAAVSVSKKYFKKAVDRNRIKRLMREAYRLQKNELQDQLQQNNQQLIVFMMYVGNELPEYRIIFQKMTAVLARLQKIANEAPVADT